MLYEVITELLSRSGAQDGDLLFFGADKAKVVCDAMGALRLKLGRDLELVQPGWKPLWVIDFPMFEDRITSYNVCYTKLLRMISRVRV